MLGYPIAGRVIPNIVKVVIMSHNYSSEKLADMRTVYLLMSHRTIL